MSYASSSFRQRPSGEHADRLRQRLRFGAMASARSAITQTEVTENVVDVGEDAVPNIFEQLLARLEQHGLRRCFAEEGEGDSNDDNSGREFDHVEKAHVTGPTPTERGSNGNFSVVRPLSRSPTSSEESKAPDDGHSSVHHRVPYYYMCVPCELRLTPISTKAATLCMLQDAHYHFSSADHRSTASWMGEPDIDVTLQSTPFVDPSGYKRICVNGVPVLLSTRPGGGDMFYPLPHETDDGARAIGRNRLFAVERGTVRWHRPLQSLYGGARQLLFRAPPRRGGRRERAILRSQGRHAFAVCRVPMREYAEDSFVGGALVPALFEIGSRAAPLAVWGEEENKGEEGEGPQVAVSEDGAYRVALVSQDVAERSQRDAAERGKGAENGDGQVWLTRALLREADVAGNTSGDESMSSSVAPSSYCE